MSENTGNVTNLIPTPGKGEPVEAAGQQQVSSQGQPAEPVTYVTKAELDAALKKVVANSQQVVGQVESRIEKKLAQLTAAGIQATPEQAKQLVDAEAQQQATLQGQPAGPAPTQGQPEGLASSDTVLAQAIVWAKEDGLPNPDPLNLEGYRIMAEAGVRLKDGDPELDMIDPSATPEEWKRQVKAAVDKAAARMAASGNPARMPAAAAGQPSGLPSHHGKSGSETLDEYFKSLNLSG